MSFVHLHLHSEYSLLDGACRVDDIPRAAKEMGHSAVAITDHGVMYGAVKFYKACKKEGVKPIIGCEVYVSEGSRTEKNKMNPHHHMILLVKSEVGYKNLIYMVSRSFTDGFYVKPRIDLDLLYNHSDGLVCLSACISGQIPSLILSGNVEGAEKYALKMNRLFGDGNFYLELQNHGLAEESTVNNGLLEIHKNTGIPLVCTNDVHYIKKSDAESQAVLACIQTQSSVEDGNPLGFNSGEFYYKSTEEMKMLFGQYENAIENTVKIAEMCNYDFDFSKMFLPRYATKNGEEPSEMLKRLSYEGLDRRHNDGQISFDGRFSREDYIKRMEGELEVIAGMGYSEYFLIVWDFVHYAKSINITVGPGRGSGAGSLVAFLIGITDIDSLKYDLIFESFLNVDRVSMPDFDIDFADNRREEVIDYVKMRYGEDRVSQIITFGTMSARAVIRDVGRALSMPYNVVDSVAKLIPRELNITLKDALEIPEFKNRYNSEADIKKLVDMSMALEGMPRHASTHAAGVVITDKPVCEYVPLSLNSGNPLTQFDMDTIAELGLLKFDFLGIRYLTVIAEAEAQIKKNEPDFDIERVSFDDEKTYKLICRGNTEGVFQLNSQGMRVKLTQMKPSCLDDITAAIALYRPGPMKAGAVDAYSENKRDRNNIRYVTERLAPVLDSTYGCLVYQEQVAQIFRELAGYSFSRADNVRRAIKKKKASVIEAERELFIEGAEKNGIPREASEKIYSDIEGFSSYAFNKSHATAYAVTAYRTAYLKAHYKKEYYCALITAEMGNQGKVYEYIAEFRKDGIKVMPPCVNYSYDKFTVDAEGNIRYALLGIMNIGRPLVAYIVRERESHGLFKSFEDFINRMKGSDLNKRQLEMLVKSGALDVFGEKRSSMLAMIDSVIADMNSQNSAMAGQMDLFSMLDEDDKVSAFTIPDLPDLSYRQKLKYEKECLGMYLSGSLADEYSEHIATLNSTKIYDVINIINDEESKLTDGSKIVLTGIINRRSDKKTRKGDQMAFIDLEDSSGEIEVVIFPKVLQSAGYLLVKDVAVAISGTVSVKDDAVSVLANSVIPLIENSAFEESRKKAPESDRKAPKLYIKIDDVGTPTYNEIHRMLEENKGSIQVLFYSENRQKYIRENGLTVNASADLTEKLKKLLGKDRVIIK